MSVRLLIAGVVGFVCGIATYSFFPLPASAIGFCTLLAAVFFILFLIEKKQTFLITGIVLFASVLGLVRTALVPTNLPESFAHDIGTEVSYEGVVVADPDVRENTQRLTIEVKREDSTTRIVVVAPLYPSVTYGETIQAEGILELPDSFDTNGGRTFAYDKFLAKDGVFALIQKAYITQIAEREGIYMHIRGALSDMRFAGLDALGKALPEPESSLAGGLILGGKQGLGKELLNDFITSGLVHIVVLSGYNVMIVAEFMLRVFGFLSKRFAAITAVLAILSFVFVAGAGAASIRAGIMASIALYGRASGNTLSAFHALLFAGVLMLLINPLTLVYDPGFQLSFIATLGLIFGAPITERWFSFVSSKFLREIMSSTVAAQISVLPLLLYQNGLFSFIALPANLLVLPVVPFAMLLSGIAGLCGLLAPSIAPIVAFPAYLLLSYITNVVQFTAGLPLAAITIPAFPFWVVVMSYVALVYRVTTQRVPKSVSLPYPN